MIGQALEIIRLLVRVTSAYPGMSQGGWPGYLSHFLGGWLAAGKLVTDHAGVGPS